MDNIKLQYRWNAILRRLPAEECKAAEVGVWKGSLSLKLLERHSKLQLYLIDRWKPYTAKEAKREGEYMSNATRGKFKIAKGKALEKVKPYMDRVHIYEMDSLTAARQFKDKYFDLVFIDALHSFKGCKSDILAWLPKVKQGGYISGHDYPRRPGVVQAVNEIFSNNDIEIDIDNTWFAKVQE